MGALITTWFLTMVICAPLAATRWAGRTLSFEDSYGHEAAANLSAFRSELFKEWYQAQRDGPAVDKARFRLYNPIVTCPPSMPLTQVPEWYLWRDGVKLLCGVQELEAPCVVYSLGHGKNYKFEKAILEMTPCEVHTFDCTMDAESLDPRHKYHRLCFGSPNQDTPEEMKPMFTSLHNITKKLGHEKINILKVDIESSEYALFSEWHEGELHLPDQIVVEFHLVHSGNSIVASEAELGLAMLHLANLGYAGFYKDPNFWHSDRCWEYSFIRVEKPLLHTHAHAIGGPR